MKVRLIGTETPGTVQIQMRADGLSGFFAFRPSRRAQPGFTDNLRLNVNCGAGSTLMLLRPDGTPYDYWTEKKKVERAKVDALNGAWTMTGEFAHEAWGTAMFISGGECWGQRDNVTLWTGLIDASALPAIKVVGVAAKMSKDVHPYPGLKFVAPGTLSNGVLSLDAGHLFSPFCGKGSFARRGVVLQPDGDLDVVVGCEMD